MSNTHRDMPPGLRAWLDERPDADRDELERTWMLADFARGEKPNDEAVDAAWRDVDAVLEAPAARRPCDRRPARRPRRHALRWTAVAAVVIALVGAAIWWWTRPVEVVVPPGMTASVKLPDGSTAWLNSGSQLTYRRGLFSWDRTVRLKGEAFFDVTERGDPFTVTTFNARVEVLGTRFNIRARSGTVSPATTVVLAEGRVRFYARGAPEQAVTLRPGQGSRIVGRGRAPTPPQPVDLKAALAWRSGGLAFSKAPIRAILAEIERRFDVSIRVAAPALLGDSLSLYLPNPQSAEAVLRDLCAYRSCHVRRTHAGFALYAAKRQL